jgi:outer membrane protein, heavy metal efflux system
MKAFTWLGVCVAAGSLAAGPLRGQQIPVPDRPAVLTSEDSPARSPAGIALAAALDSAWQRAVTARESDALRRRAEADRAVAASIWAAPPSVNLSHLDDRINANAGRRESEIGVSVPLWLPGQRAARASTADAAAGHAQAAERLARLRLAGEVREVAWEFAAARAEVMQADANAKVLEQLADDVARRVRLGDLARADSLAAQAEHLAASALQASLQQRQLAAKARWALLTGQALLPDLAAPAAADDAALALHPELQLASQSLQLARQRVALMRHSHRDAPELSLGVRQDTAGRTQSAQGSLIVSLRLPLGTPDRNRPLEAAALAELDIAQTQEERLRERLESEARVAREAGRAAAAQRDAEATRATLMRERAVLIEKSFRAGETSLPELLRALAAAAQAESDLARQTAALGLARARHQQALGLLP